MPMFTKIQISTMIQGVVLSFLNQNNCGLITLQVTNRPLSPPVRFESTVGESKLFFLHLAVPGNEKLSSIRKPDD